MSSLGSASVPAGGANPFSTGHQAAFYRISTIVTKYVWNNGTHLLPVSKPGTSPNQVLSSVICQTSSPFGYKVVSWVLERAVFLPLLPDVEPDNPNQKIGSYEITFSNQQPEANATPIYHVEGTYVYLLLQPISIKNGIFHIGSQPVVMDQGGQSVNSSQFLNLTPTFGSEQPG